MQIVPADTYLVSAGTMNDILLEKKESSLISYGDYHCRAEEDTALDRLHFKVNQCASLSTPLSVSHCMGKPTVCSCMKKISSGT